MLARSGSAAEYGDRWSVLCEIVQLCQTPPVDELPVIVHVLSLAVLGRTAALTAAGHTETPWGGHVVWAWGTRDRSGPMSSSLPLRVVPNLRV